jgi:HEAT repeat protein
MTSVFLGYSGQAFILFFLFVALTRLFNSMLRDSLENPVYKLMFIPLDSRYRFSIQSKIEGVVNESGRFIAGLVVFAFSQLVFFKIAWIPVMVLLLGAVYMLLVKNLYQGYRNKIRSKLESSEFHEDKLEIGFKQITSTLQSQLGDRKTSKAVFSFKLLEKLNPSNVGVWVNALMKNRSEEAQDYAQRRMNEMKGLSVSENYIIRIDRSKTSGEGKNILTGTDLEQVLRSGGDITRARIQKLARSADAGDRHYAAELLLHSSSVENTTFLIELLSDTDTNVRRTALATSAKRFNSEVINAVIENLNNPLYSNLAMNSLVLMGTPALNYLDSGFYRSGQQTQTMVRIVQVLGHIGGNRAKELLWNKIDYPDKVIVSQVLLSLGECGFKAGIAQVTRIKYAIENDIADLTWNLSAIRELGDSEQADQVRLALRQEISHDIEHIYMLLAMLYDTRSIQLVKENIESGTSEGTTYAVELLDVFLSEQLKMRVIPVLDDLSDFEKIKRLEVFYPRVTLDSKLSLKFLVNRDFTQTNRWTKAAVIYQIGLQKIADFKLDLIAQLFNPDRLIREAAGWSLNEIDPKVYSSNVNRLEETYRRWLDRAVLKNKSGHKLMLYEKVVFFQNISVFYGIPGLTLSYLADISKEQKLAPEEYLSVDERLNNDFYIIYSGSVKYYENSRFVKDFQKGQFVGEMLSAPGFINTNMLVAKEETTLLKINKDQFYELLSDHVKLTDKFLQFI